MKLPRNPVSRRAVLGGAIVGVTVIATSADAALAKGHKPTLRLGSRGPVVRQLQGLLNKQSTHPRLVEDGVFGPKTDAAVRHFQDQRGLVIDGIVGPKTWAELDRPSHKDTKRHVGHATLRYGSQDGEVWLAQAKVGKILVDGIFGAHTESQVKHFQGKHGLVTDGIVGPKTWAKLDNQPLHLSRLQLSPESIAAAKGRYGWAIDASKDTDMLYLLHRYGGRIEVAAASRTSFGGRNKDGKFHTPNGNYPVLRKAGPKEVSHMWDDPHGKPAKMPWAVYITPAGMAVHQDPLGNSHACVHIPSMGTAEYVNKHIPVGARVIIHGQG